MKNGNGTGLWLVVDPRREQGYTPATFDPATFLPRAVALFQSKPTWSGQRPNAVKANPAQAGNRLEPAADALGLRVIGDPAVLAGTFWLGMDDGQEVDK